MNRRQRKKIAKLSGILSSGEVNQRVPHIRRMWAVQTDDDVRTERRWDLERARQLNDDLGRPLTPLARRILRTRLAWSRRLGRGLLCPCVWCGGAVPPDHPAISGLALAAMWRQACRRAHRWSRCTTWRVMSGRHTLHRGTERECHEWVRVNADDFNDAYIIPPNA